jgi:hypothetical protein
LEPLFHEIDNEQMVCYTKRTEDLGNIILVVVNLDPHHVQSGWVRIPLEPLQLGGDGFLSSARSADRRAISLAWRKKLCSTRSQERTRAHLASAAAHSPRAGLRLFYVRAMQRAKPASEDFALDDDPLWYKSAVIYELHVRAFSDGNADGIGDFKGLTEKLDYLSDLGVTVLWLLPFYPSPLKDDGYDIASYTEIHPDYGTLKDFKVFLSEAHQRGIRVITELVLNHTSDQHPWFQRARRAPAGSKERDYYVWSDNQEQYKEARIIFKDFETSNWAWDPVAKGYFWHRFYSHQPDLNFDNPAVKDSDLRSG